MTKKENDKKRVRLIGFSTTSSRALNLFTGSNARLALE